MPRPPASYQAVIPMAFSPATNLRTFAIHCSVSGSGIFAATKATPPTRNSSCSGARMKWAWLSMSPGITVCFLRSITFVPPPWSSSTSALLPTATMRCPRIASPCAIVKRSSTVTILPFTRMVSAGSAARAGDAIAHSNSTPAAATPAPGRSHFIAVPPYRLDAPRGNDNPLPSARGRARCANGAPDALGRRRQLDVPHAEFRECVHDRVRNRSERGRRAAFASGADAERVRRRRHLAQLGRKRRKKVRPGHGVVQERSRQHLSGFRVVTALLEQRLARALHDAAVSLAVENERIHGAADVVHGCQAHDFHHAGVGIDFHLAHLAAVGKRGDAEGLGMRGGERLGRGDLENPG